MPESLYPEVGGSREATGPEEGQENEHDESGETALLPKSILAGKEFRPGEEVVLTIVRVHDDEVEVEYASEKPETENKSEGMSADEEIDGMAMDKPMMKGY